MRGFCVQLLCGGLVGIWGLAAAAQTEIVVVDDTFFDFFNAPQNPGCGGCGLLDWDDLYNNGYACRRLPSETRGALCGGLVDPPDPDWDDPTALAGSLEIQSELTTRFDGLVTEFDDPNDPFPPYDPSVSGAIQSLTGTYALRHTGSNDGIGNTIEGHLLIKQAGDFYVSDQFVGASSGGGLGQWVRVGESGGIPIAFTAEDFGKILNDETVDTSQHPDFSESGAPLFFGFALDLSYQGPFGGLPGQPRLFRGFNVDDIEIKLTTAGLPAVAVPILTPMGIGVLGALLVAAQLVALRRVQRARA